MSHLYRSKEYRCCVNLKLCTCSPTTEMSWMTSAVWAHSNDMQTSICLDDRFVYLPLAPFSNCFTGATVEWRQKEINSDWSLEFECHRPRCRDIRVQSKSCRHGQNVTRSWIVKQRIQLKTNENRRDWLDRIYCESKREPLTRVSWRNVHQANEPRRQQRHGVDPVSCAGDCSSRCLT